jgi:hypothetical protein
MKGKRWYDGPVELGVIIYAPGFERGKSMTDYEGGVMDTLDGSHGYTFTYLPIVYQDDCQVVKGDFLLKKDSRSHYRIVVRFLKGV